METTFMTIHNLTREANILFASESIADILGFQVEDVVGRSCFDYFHPDEVPMAKYVQNRGVELDKAAVIHYARIMNGHGQWVTCECVFTVVYDVMVACTSIYRGDARNEQRRIAAEPIRRLFASSPKDPRYHMLEHLSAKFRTPPQASLREPRAALILNRFTRTLTVMYATDAVADILGVTADQLKDKSFYECMQGNCLPDAIRALESAKANDSIAYLRFWYRDPRREEDHDEEMREASASDSEDGGVELHGHMDVELGTPAPGTSGNGAATIAAPPMLNAETSRTNSGTSTNLGQDADHAIFDHDMASRSSSSSLAVISPEERMRRRRIHAPRPIPEAREIEAVVSCTSDGLVVVLRRARPIIPSMRHPAQVPQYANGLFAAPWGAVPIRPHVYQPNPQFPFQHGFQAPQVPVGGPPLDDFMASIRDVAVFAWSLTGINGNIASYAHGLPRGEAVPPRGFPVWDPHAQPSPNYSPPENQATMKWSRLSEKAIDPGSQLPYQHLREEQLLRHHPAYILPTTGLNSYKPPAMGLGPAYHTPGMGYNPVYQPPAPMGYNPAYQAPAAMGFSQHQAAFPAPNMGYQAAFQPRTEPGQAWPTTAPASAPGNTFAPANPQQNSQSPPWDYFRDHNSQ